MDKVEKITVSLLLPKTYPYVLHLEPKFEKIKLKREPRPYVF